MEIRFAPRMAVSFLALAMAGCAWLNVWPSARQERNPTPDANEPPQVVEDSAPAGENTGEDLQAKVARWVERLETAKRSGSPPETEATSDDASLAADSQNTPDTEPKPTPNQRGSSVEASPPTGAGGSSTPELSVAPELGLVAVRAAPNGTGAVLNPPGPSVNATANAPGAPTSLTDVLERLGPGADDSFREQVDRRMLWAVAGDYDRAREPLKVVTAEQQELATRFIEAWIVIRENHQGDPAGAAQAAARELVQLQTALGRLSDLRVPVLKICSVVRGYGQYEALDPARFSAGIPNEFVLYCELSDFVSEERDDGYFTTSFDLTTTILDHAGDAVLELKDTNIVDRCRNRRRDCFIPRLVRLPPTLSPGHFVARVTVVDKLGQKVAQERIPFQLVARP